MPMTGEFGLAAVLPIGVWQQSTNVLDNLLEKQTPDGVHARSELHVPGRHLEDVRSAGRIEHIGSP